MARPPQWGRSNRGEVFLRRAPTWALTSTLNKFYVETLPIPLDVDEALMRAVEQRVVGMFGVSEPPVADPAIRLRMRMEMDALVAHLFDIPEDLFAHILLDPLAKPKGFDRVDQDLPEQLRQPQLTLDAYRQLLHKGLDRFLQDGAEIPKAALGHRWPLIDIWSPADGWEAAWAEAQSMAQSDHKWDLFLGKEHAVQAEYSNLEGALELAGSPEHGKESYHAKPQSGALFDPPTSSGRTGSGGCYDSIF